MLARFSFLWLLGTCSLQIEGRLLQGTTNFEKVMTFDQKYTIIADPPTTRSGSFVYAACELTVTNNERHCSVALETVAFVDAVYKNVCPVHIKADNPKQENITNLEIYSFNEEVVLLSWLVESEKYEYFGKIRILNLMNCKFMDLIVPANHVPYVLVRSASFDVILANETYCAGATFCKMTHDIYREKMSGPLQISHQNNYKNTYQSVNSTGEQSVSDVLCWQTLMVDLNFDGNKTDALWLTRLCNFRISTANNLLSVCILNNRTDVICLQYDEHMNLQMNVTFEFIDGKLQRWLQPYNLKHGTILIVTGTPNDAEGKRYDSFSVIKFHENQSKTRPLEISGLNFECNPNSLHVTISETDKDEVCFHFVCDRLIQFQHSRISSRIKFAIKCLPGLL